ncbi:MAG: GNAT family N-acetyltransferase [Candidatus Rokuibacteriota bacterium]
MLVVGIWGLAFVATKLALESFSPPQLTALRFLIAALPALVLPRPALAWPRLIAIGATLFAGQFLLQFFAIASGLPPGLASLLVQTQALFTIVFAALALRERPTAREISGVAVAVAGLGLILLTLGQDLTVVGFCLALGSAISWGIGNVLLKRIRDVEMLDLIVWLSLVPPLPSLAISLVLDGPTGLTRAVASASWLAIAAVLYLGVAATILAYAIWGRLLRRYPAATVTPFALLVPFVGGYSSALVFGERFGPLRLAGMALVLLGIAVIVLPRSGGAIRAISRARPRGTSLPVTAAVRADAPGVVELIGRVYTEYGFVYEPQIEVPDLLRFDHHYAPPRGAFFVVREDGVVVGSVGVERLDGGGAEVHRLYLDRHLRGRGTGRALLERVLEWCRAQNIRHLILWSDTRFDQAHRLYERMGFQRTGERALPDDPNQTREYGFERPV